MTRRKFTFSAIAAAIAGAMVPRLAKAKPSNFTEAIQANSDAPECRSVKNMRYVQCPASFQITYSSRPTESDWITVVELDPAS